MNMKYAVIYEKAPKNWGAYVPDLPGCVATGTTIDETRATIAEAIEFHIDGLKRLGREIPEPTTVAEMLDRPA